MGDREGETTTRETERGKGEKVGDLSLRNLFKVMSHISAKDHEENDLSRLSPLRLREVHHHVELWSLEELVE
jgi:hypothetical protein